MGNRRSSITMTDAEREAFLRAGRTLNLASIGLDGRPHLVAMWYCFIEETIWCWTYAKSQKAFNLRRDPRVTGLVEAGERYEELRGVTLYARAHITEDLDQIQRVGASLFARYQSGDSTVTEETFLGSAPKRIAFALVVEDFVSWDHRKLHGGY